MLLTLTRSSRSVGLVCVFRVSWARVATADDLAMPTSVSMFTWSVAPSPGSKMAVTETRDSEVYSFVDSRLKAAPSTTKAPTTIMISFFRRPIAAT